MTESSSPATAAATPSTTLGLQNLAGAKLRKQLMSGSGSLFQERASAPPSNFARQQLEQMGWTEGTGLGKARNGVTTHIRVVKRADSAGLGTEQEAHQTALNDSQNEWWKASLGDTLAKLGGGKKRKKRNSSDEESENDSDENTSDSGKKKQKKRKRSEKKKTKKSKTTFTDEELFEATGGARFGMRAGKTRNLAKWKRAESGESLGSDSTVVPTTTAESLSSSSSSLDNLDDPNAADDKDSEERIEQKDGDLIVDREKTSTSKAKKAKKKDKKKKKKKSKSKE